MRMTQKQDFFTALGGGVKFLRGQYNITSDAVWLAAFAASKAEGDVLDVGIGTGGVSLCLLSHNPDVKITGLDISESMLKECEKNAALNGRELELINADILGWKTRRTFDAVMTNPPYFKGSAAKHNAHHNTDIYEWTRACLRRVRPRGSFFTIVDAAQTAQVVAALHDARAGAIEILPLFGGAKSVAERVLIRARSGVKTGAIVRTAMIMNDKEILMKGKPI
jgi:tRNA1(Val) A37 N6-methylase TrmN6